jgi:hypothetical protein
MREGWEGGREGGGERASERRRERRATEIKRAAERDER